MIKEGYELILGSKRDEKFGPIILFGLGGIYVEVLKDITFRLAHIREFSAYRMPCLVILKFRLFLIFPHPPSNQAFGFKKPHFLTWGLRPPNSPPVKSIVSENLS
jgi:Acyl-CoA synthetase (NDP forming)